MKSLVILCLAMSQFCFLAGGSDLTWTSLPAGSEYHNLETDGNECTSSSNDVNNPASTSPTCSISGPNHICPATIHEYSGPPGLSYQWSVIGVGSIISADDMQTVTVESLPIACNNGIHLTLVVTDEEGNTSSCLLIIINHDLTAPTATQGSIAACYATTAEAEAAAIAATTNLDDNCTNAEDLDVTAATVGTCSAVVTVTVTDECSNFNEYEYNTQIHSTTPPSEVGGPVSTDGGTVECIDDASAPLDLPVVEDVCGNTLPDPTPTNGGTYDECEGTYTWVYTYIDCAGLEFIWTYTYNIELTSLTPPDNESETIPCAVDATNPGPPADISDACGRTVSPVLVGSSFPPNQVVWTYRYTACDGTTADWTYTYDIVFVPGECLPPVASCGVITVYVNPNDPAYDGPGTNNVWLIPALDLDAGSTWNSDFPTIQTRRHLTQITFDWTTNGACIDVMQNSTLNNIDRGIVYRDCLPVRNADFNIWRIYQLLIQDQYGSSSCYGTVKVRPQLPVFSSVPIVHVVLPAESQEKHVEEALKDLSIREDTRQVDAFGGFDIVMYPNPGKDLVQLSWTSSHEESASILITDVNGQIYSSNEYRVLEGENLFLVDMTTHDTGVYFISIRSESQQKAMKWIKTE